MKIKSEVDGKVFNLIKIKRWPKNTRGNGKFIDFIDRIMLNGKMIDLYAEMTSGNHFYFTLNENFYKIRFWDKKDEIPDNKQFIDYIYNNNKLFTIIK